MNTNKDWLDIATAPKDGTEILAWRSDCGQFIAKYTSADAFPMTQDELDAMDEDTLFSKDWFTQWPDATRLDGSEAPTLWQPLPSDPCLTCGGHGMVGGLTQHSGYDAEPCPDCCPSPASTVATEGEKDEGGLLNIKFTPVSEGLPELVEYSSSYGGQWSSDWCAVITARGYIEHTRLVVPGSQKDAPEKGQFYGTWRAGMDPSRVIAWVYLDRIRSAADAAIAQQSQRKEA